MVCAHRLSDEGFRREMIVGFNLDCLGELELEKRAKPHSKIRRTAGIEHPHTEDNETTEFDDSDEENRIFTEIEEELGIERN